MNMFTVDLSRYDQGEFLRLAEILKNCAHTIRPLYDPPKTFLVSWDEGDRPIADVLKIPSDLVQRYQP